MSTPIVGALKVPSVTIFVRHSADCPHKANESYRRCQCRKHLRWSYGGKQFRKSAKTRSWQTAEDRRREVEAQVQNEAATRSNGDVALQTVMKPTIEDAIKLFIKDKRSQGLDEGFVKRYERELGRMSDFMMRRNILFPCEIEVQHLTEFRAEWNSTYKSSVTRSKVQERLRAFLRYCFNARMTEVFPFAVACCAPALGTVYAPSAKANTVKANDSVSFFTFYLPGARLCTASFDSVLRPAVAAKNPEVFLTIFLPRVSATCKEFFRLSKLPLQL